MIALYFSSLQIIMEKYSRYGRNCGHDAISYYKSHNVVASIAISDLIFKILNIAVFELSFTALRQWHLSLCFLALSPLRLTLMWNKQIEQKYAKETAQLNPPHRFVPWVVVNNQALQEVCDWSEKNLQPKWVLALLRPLTSSAFSCGCRTTKILWPIFAGLTRAIQNQMLVDHFQQELMSQIRISMPINLFAMLMKQKISPD